MRVTIKIRSSGRRTFLTVVERLLSGCSEATIFTKSLHTRRYLQTTIIYPCLLQH